MPSGKSNKHQRALQQRRARAAAIAAAQRRQTRQRRLLIGGLGLVVLAAVAAAVILLMGDDDEPTPVTTLDATTTTPGIPSAAGKPCVARTGDLPAGAPDVPVKVDAPPTELVKEDLKPGTGAEVPPGSTVTVHYIGVSCSTGKIFDSSYSRNQPATFALTSVIPGWTNGIPGMKIGGQRLLGIPAEQAYGESGRPPDIAPNEPLWFVVEVLDAKAG